MVKLTEGKITKIINTMKTVASKIKPINLNTMTEKDKMKAKETNFIMRITMKTTVMAASQ